MSEINKAKEMIQKGIDHIEESSARSKKMASTINELKGNLYAGADAVSEAIKLLTKAKTNFEAISGQAGEISTEIRKSSNIFESVGAGMALPNEVLDTIAALNYSADGIDSFMTKFAGSGIEEPIRLLNKIYAGLTNEGTAQSLDAATVVANDYASRVAPYHVEVADTWTRTL